MDNYENMCFYKRQQLDNMHIKSIETSDNIDI